MSKKYMFGVPNVIFVLLLLSVLAVFFFGWLVLFVVIPVFGYYIWQISAKNKELEERLAAVEGRR